MKLAEKRSDFGRFFFSNCPKKVIIKEVFENA